jgi:hypothetical protein
MLGLYLSVSSALAATVAWPAMTVQIGGEAIQMENVYWNYDAALDRFSLAGPYTATASNGSTFTINSADAVPDPVLFFSASAVNTTGGPLSYSFSFNTPLVPSLLGPVDSHAELGLTLTDGFNNGATVQPVVPGGKILTSFDLDVSGAPVPKNVDVGDLFSILNGTGGTTFSKDSSLVCNQACVTMSAILAFTLTGEDSVGFSGRVVQTPVPLPAAGWLFMSSLIGLAGAMRRKLSLA